VAGVINAIGRMCAAAILALALTWANGLVADEPAGPVSNRGYVWMGTGGPAGTYYSVGTDLCDLINTRSKPIGGPGGTKLYCTTALSGGSTYNLKQISIGAFTFGLSQSDAQYYSHQGSRPSAVAPFKGLRSVLSLYPEPVQLVVAKGSGIEKFSDIRGKRINIGNRGSGTRTLMSSLMDAYGIPLKALEEATGFTSKEHSDALCSGRIDGYVAVTTFPAPQIARTIERCGARLINLNSDVEAKMVASFPFYEVVTIPAGAYANMTQEVKTIGVVATLVTGRRVDASAVYEVVRTIMENADALRAQTPAPIFKTPQQMIRDGLSAPLHPGAVRYYIEQGWL
jgi:TRAP transporter TAXI family solute receptor